MSDTAFNRNFNTTRNFVTAKTTDPCYRKIEITVCKSGFFYWCELEGVLVRQSKIDGPVQKVVQVSFRARVRYMSHYPSSLVIQARDDFTIRYVAEFFGHMRLMMHIQR